VILQALQRFFISMTTIRIPPARQLLSILQITAIPSQVYASRLAINFISTVPTPLGELGGDQRA
jgi:hypothetical protein